MIKVVMMYILEAVGSGKSTCEGKPNGAYTEGCSSVFYICINENIFFLYCRNSMKFDENSGQCVEPVIFLISFLVNENE